MICEIKKAAGEYSQWLGATSQSFEEFTSLDELKMHFWSFFSLNEKRFES